MGSQLRWLERTPDKREVDGSIPFEPTMKYKSTSKKHIENYIEKIDKRISKKKVNQNQESQEDKEAMLNIENLLTMKSKIRIRCEQDEANEEKFTK